MAESTNQNPPDLAADEQSERSLSSADSTAVGAVAGKVCCMCGVDLHGRTRYKDNSGRYWCPTCNEKDQSRREPAVCPDCNGNFTKADLIEFKGTPVCQTCWERRRQTARREESRLRAVEEEILATQESKRRWGLISLVIVVILVLWAMLYYVFSGTR